MGIAVIGAVFVDIKGFPEGAFIPEGRNAGSVVHIHGGVGRNIAEDVANCELRPTFISLVDDTPEGEEVRGKLRRHKVNTDYILSVPDGMGTWLAVFNADGDVYASISKRPDLRPLAGVLEKHGDAIFRDADSVIIEIDLDKQIVKQVLQLARKFNRRVYAVVSNMSIALERRDFLKNVDCFICNQQEAMMLFAEDCIRHTPEALTALLAEKVRRACIPAMIVTMGAEGAVFATANGERGWVPARKVAVNDTTGAGDAFAAGAAIGLTYGKSLEEACRIGAQLASSVIVTAESVCPRFMPEELGLEITGKCERE